MTISIVCQLEVESLTHVQAQVFEDALREASKRAFPEKRIKALWVHRDNLSVSGSDMEDVSKP